MATTKDYLDELRRISRLHAAAVKRVEHIAIRPDKYTAREARAARQNARNLTAQITYIARCAARTADTHALTTIETTPHLQAGYTPLRHEPTPVKRRGV